MITSRLTSKAQTTVPQPVRNALKLREGDVLAYEIDGDRVILSKANPAEREDPFRTFSEWHSDADAKAYADL
ncbi:AbrB/MazE/SpoVT family DNA-binding domain-containing protein [Methyloraptor flagellatus]|uniref:Type II toxin-antitoxin system PrlF family antitoxin n=1 Tax=Methyloraptor flagellatus TaxID=3162530 RepID=A0AAU7X872_9HYPH